MRATFGQVVASQDAEFELGLLHDQFRDLQNERTSLQSKIEEMQTSLEACSQLRRNAETRLERYGENPKFRKEAETAEQAEVEVRQPLAEAKERLLLVEAGLPAFYRGCLYTTGSLEANST